MSIQRFISTQGNEFSSDCTLEFPKSSGQVQDFVDQQLQYSSYMELCNFQLASSSSSSIISCIGSPSSAFFATERCLGLTQYDNQDDTSQLTKNYDLQMSSYDPQQCRNGFFEDSMVQSEPISLPSFISPEGPCRQYTFSDASEEERMLHLKNKLLGEFDASYRRHPALPFDGNQDYCLSHDLCGSQLTHTRQQSSSPSLTCHNSASSGATQKPSKTRIRWTEDLHDRFLECANRLGGADKATPKQILNLMDSESLTLDQVKSHLQKYRNAKHPESAGKSEKRNSLDTVTDIESKTATEITEALKMQLEVQRCLHEQLENQRTLQTRIEEQAKKLRMILDQQQNTNRTVLETRNSNVSSELVNVNDSVDCIGKNVMK
ncbi:myb family transcription factor PHL13 [Capsicum chacoense]